MNIAKIIMIAIPSRKTYINFSLSVVLLSEDAYELTKVSISLFISISITSFFGNNWCFSPLR